MLRAAGLTINRCFSWNAWLARGYLLAWARVLARFPDGGWLRRHVGSSLRSTAWPPMHLPPRELELGGGVRARLLPAPGSMGFRALYQDRLGHEDEVFGFLAGRMHGYDAVLEVGANVGVYTLFFSRRLAQRDARVRVFAYEAAPAAYALLQRHLELNGCTNVQAVQAAVCGHAGTVEFYENPRDLMKGSLDAAAAARFPGRSPQPLRVPAVDGAEIAPRLDGFGRVLLKLDVVGGEPQVLEALRVIIEAKAPDIVLGVWAPNLDGLNRLEFLRGYRLARIGGAGLEARERFSDADYCNYFLERRG